MSGILHSTDLHPVIQDVSSHSPGKDGLRRFVSFCTLMKYLTTPQPAVLLFAAPLHLPSCFLQFPWYNSWSPLLVFHFFNWFGRSNWANYFWKATASHDSFLPLSEHVKDGNCRERFSRQTLEKMNVYELVQFLIRHGTQKENEGRRKQKSLGLSVVSLGQISMHMCASFLV